MSAFVFDLDGTLADSRECLILSLNHAFHKVGLPDFDFCKIQSLQQDLATTFRSAIEKLALPFKEEQLREFIHEFRWFHEHEGERVIKVYDGLQATLETLKKTHVLAVATTKHTSQARRVLRKLKIDRYFDHIQGTDPGMKYKPDPEILLRALKVLEIPTRLAAYVGDGKHDMTAARRGGLLAVGAAYGFGGDSVFNPEESDHLVYHHQELLSIRVGSGPRSARSLAAQA